MSKSLLEALRESIGTPLQHAPAFTGWLGGILRKVEEGHIVMEVEVRSEMTNPLGLLHGGVQAAILDELIGMTVAALDKPGPAVSVNLSIDFIGKARVGEWIRAESRLIRQGRQIICMEGSLYNAQNQLIAKASTNLLNIQKA